VLHVGPDPGALALATYDSMLGVHLRVTLVADAGDGFLRRATVDAPLSLGADLSGHGSRAFGDALTLLRAAAARGQDGPCLAGAQLHHVTTGPLALLGLCAARLGYRVVGTAHAPDRRSAAELLASIGPETTAEYDVRFHFL
jgi:hypothetical protein